MRTSDRAGSGRSAALVAIGIFCSKVAGLVRQRVFSHYFGLTASADAFTASIRIPNLLNNLFGEGALSGSFIPVYAALVARGEHEEADRVAGAVASLLALVVSGLVLVGVLATPVLIEVIAPGFSGSTRQLAIVLVRILFPAVGLTVMSAWCLGVLNSHHRFLLSYAAPVIWNAAMIVTMIAFGAGRALPDLARILAWGSVVGSGLMVAVQLPVVFRIAPHLKFALDTTSDHVRTVISNFTGVFLSRGVVQVSGYIDTLLATLVSTGATTALMNAQTLYLLPVSLFGMSVSAAELPAMSGIAHGSESAERLRTRLGSGLRQIAFFVVPSAVAFLTLGDVVAAAIFQTGRFTHADAVYVWGILAGSAVGLLASTLGRLYASTYYALRDTRTPLRFAIIRVVLTTVLGYLFAIPLPRWIGIAPSWGAAGLTASAGIAGWIEMLLLRRTLTARLGATALSVGYVVRLWFAALTAAAVGWAVKLTFFPPNPILDAVVILIPYGLVFFAMTFALRIPEASTAFARLRRIR
ncbi:MAG TPA: murein biosynthesis integral membrane protein MurJ [Vicinamibacterales bacterium]